MGKTVEKPAGTPAGSPVQRADQAPSMPESVQNGLDRFCEQLQESLGDRLVSVVLYGSLARDDYDERNSDVNVLVIVTDTANETLEKMERAVRQGREIRLSAVTLSEEELRHSTDVFPIRFLDIQQHHRTLAGRDVISGLAISRLHLRLRCEQEIKQRLLALRQTYILRSNLRDALEEALVGAVASVLCSLGVLVELKTGTSPANREEILEAIARIGLDPHPVRDVLALKRGELRIDAEETKRLYRSFLEVVQEAATLVDEA